MNPDTLAKWLLTLIVSFGIVSHAKASTVRPTGGMGLTYGAGSLSMGDGADFARFMNRTITGGTDGAKIAEAYRLSVGGAEADIIASRVLPAVSVAAGAIAAFTAGAAVGGAISHWLGNDEVTLGGARCQASYSGWQCDVGQPLPASSMNYRVADFPNVIYHSVIDACRGAWTMYGGGGDFTPQINGDGSCRAYNQFGQMANWFAPVIQLIGNDGCPASIDALNPAYSVPAGSPVGPDGKCKTGRYQNMTPQDAADRVAQYSPQSNVDQLPGLAQRVLDQGFPITTPNERVLTGPGTLTGQPTTTTTVNPDGSTTTTTTTPTNRYAYNGPTVSYTTTSSTVTNTCTVAGACTTTTTTTSAPPTEETDPCKANPNSVGCMALGDPPTDAPKWQQMEVPFTVEDLGLGSGCPSARNVSFTLFGAGRSVSMDYSPLCNVAPTIALGLNAAAVLAAIGIIVTAVRS